MLHLATWAVLDQLKGPKDKGGLRFRQLRYAKKMKIVKRRRVLIYSYFEKGCPKKYGRDNPER